MARAGWPVDLARAMTRPWWATRWFALIVILASAVPLLWPSVPPLTDLPGHMGRFRVMLGGPDAGIFAAWYHFEWKAIGYLGVDLLVLVLAPLMGLEPAVKVVVIAIPMTLAGAILWISHEAHGRVQPLALLALPFAYHFGFQLGFLNYALSVALALASVAFWMRLGRAQRWVLRAAIFSIVPFIVWTAHVVGWVILCLIVFGVETGRQRDAGSGWVASGVRASVNCMPLALPAIMFLAWRPGDASTGSDWWLGLPLKPGWLVMSLRDRWRWFDVASIMLIAILLYRAIRSPHRKPAVGVAIAAVLILAFFIAMPFGSAYGDARLTAVIWILAVLAIGARETTPMREQQVIGLIGLALFAIRIAAGTASIAIEDRSWTHHLAALDQVPRGARMISLVTLTCDQPWRMGRTAHLPGMAIARRAAFSNDQFDLGGTALLTVKTGDNAGFAKDPSQIVTPAPCPKTDEFRTFNQAIDQFTRRAYDYLWLIDARPLDARQARGLRLVWRRGNDYLFMIDHRRLSPGPSTD